jgi:hypothetical protein
MVSVKVQCMESMNSCRTLGNGKELLVIVFAYKLLSPVPRTRTTLPTTPAFSLVMPPEGLSVPYPLSDDRDIFLFTLLAIFDLSTRSDVRGLLKRIA